jgi:hypothetical protein
MEMYRNALARVARLLLLVLLFAPHARTYGQESSKMGEVRFTADTQDERDAGVWIDGKYAGYVKELKGDRKVMLASGEHEITVRQAGYQDFTKKVAVDPGQSQTVAVVLTENSKAIFPGNNAAELGRFHSMLVAPGKHQLKVELDGYQPYETEITANANEKSRMNIVLQKNGDAGPGK